MIAARKKRAKASPRRNSAEPDEGGWTLAQVLVWHTERDIEVTRNCASEQGYRIYHWYPSSRDPDFPVHHLNEDVGAFNDRVHVYHKNRNARLRPIWKTARADILQNLRSGRLIAINKDGADVVKNLWQRLNLNSPEVRAFLFPSKRVTSLWPVHQQKKPLPGEIRAAIESLLKNALDRGRPSPKRELILADVRSLCPGATVRAVKEQLVLVDQNKKNKVGRPNKIGTNNPNT